MVSRHERGKEIFDAANCFCLTRNPDEDYLAQRWIMPRNAWRKMGRGISPFASSYASLIDVNDLINYQLASNKHASQLYADIVSSRQSDAAVIAYAYDSDALQDMTDAEIAQAASTEQAQTVRLDRAAEAGAVVQEMPDGYTMELLQHTSRPNTNLQASIH